MKHLISYIVAIALGTAVCYSQESSEKTESGPHRITVGLGHTHLLKGKDIDGETVWLPVTSWALNYDYLLTSKFRIGIQTDFVIEKFVVEDTDNEALERDRPVAIVPVALFAFAEHFSLVAGGGVEFEAEENLGMSRLGIEYGVEIVAGWDAKWGYYDSWGLEFTFSKNFGRER